MWGSTLVFTFASQVITGMFLWMCYSPSAQTAWESVYFIQYQMQGGWLLHGLHHFTAQAMVVLMALHLMQVVIDGAYRAPRKVNFWLGLILMQIVLALSLTGYLLPWDQKGYWATRVATNLLGVVPAVGPRLQQLVVGGTDYGHFTLTRFFALHAGVLPALLVGFLVLHVALFRRHGICVAQPTRRPECTFWPDQVLKDAVACLAVLIVVLVLVLHRSTRSLPARTPASSRRIWAPSSGRIRRTPRINTRRPGPNGTSCSCFSSSNSSRETAPTASCSARSSIPGLVMLALCLMPLIGRWQLGHRFNIALLLILLAAIGVLTGAALNEDYRAKWTNRQGFAQFEDTFRVIGADERKSLRISTTIRRRSRNTKTTWSLSKNIANRKTI